MPKWIVFDAMGVVYDEGDDIINRFVPFLHARGIPLDAETVHAVYRRASLGQIDCRGFWGALGLGDSFPAIQTEYLDTCLHLDPQFIATAGRLAKKYSLAMLSNDIAEWSAFLRRKFGLDRLLRTAVISSEAGFRKPAPEIYRILLDRLQANGEDCIFVDDRLPNLAPAAALGIAPVLFAKADAQADRECPYRISRLAELPALADEIFSS
jgi:HAD superfamily hydrolase (TIGR01509 family)